MVPRDVSLAWDRQAWNSGLLLASCPEIPLPKTPGLSPAQDAEYGRRFSNLLDELSKSQLQDPFVQSGLGHKALLEDKPERIDRSSESRPRVRGCCDQPGNGRSLAKLGRHEEAIEYLKKASDLDPYNAVMQKTLIVQYIETKAYAEARQRMERYVDTFPEDSFMRNLLAKVNRTW
ncbi:MAG: tetratricopeptide repeat protein [Acidobacteriota bacterium]|nr:tetratricopeptide repeat protein [Acidobacteriota bacterium]